MFLESTEVEAIDIMAARLRALWDHPAGLKTVFFWAPTMKWGLVFASIADMQKPAETISVPQTTALATTGLIWSKFHFFKTTELSTNSNKLICKARYSFSIIPVNYNLALVNIFVAATNIYQLSRVATHKWGKEDGNEVLAIEDAPKST